MTHEVREESTHPGGTQSKIQREAFVWFDGHLDLACLAVEGREMFAPHTSAKGGPQPAGVTFVSLTQGRVRQTLGTLFTAPNFDAAFGYPRGNQEEAHKKAIEQLAFYQQWEAEGHIELVRWREALLEEPPASGLQVVLLMEGGDPIRTPEEVAWWYAQGLRVVGLSWNTGTEYAGGNATTRGLSPAGEACVDQLEAHGMIHDLSHLSDNAAMALLDRTQGPVLASHSNSRALMEATNQRHLSDTLIARIGERKGIIGINLLSRFLTRAWRERRASIEETIAHIEHLCEVLAGRSQVALGSDMDGGFGADKLPEGISQPADLMRLLDALAARGWSELELHGFARNNWLRFFQQHLPTHEGSENKTKA